MKIDDNVNLFDTVREYLLIAFLCMPAWKNSCFMIQQAESKCPDIILAKSPPCRVDPFITCTLWQVGRLLTASLLPTSKLCQAQPGRPAIHRQSPASLIINVGLNRPITYKAGVCEYHLCIMY